MMESVSEALCAQRTIECLRIHLQSLLQLNGWKNGNVLK